MNFKKGPLALNVLVTKSDPATTANVNYTAKPLANDLPFPPDATDIAFDPNQPLLTCASSQPVAATLAYFTGQLAGMGWAPAPAGRNPNTDKAGHAYFVRADHAPLLLVAQRGDDGVTKIELKGVTAEDLAAELAPAKPAAADAGRRRSGARRRPRRPTNSAPRSPSRWSRRPPTSRSRRWPRRRRPRPRRRRKGRSKRSPRWKEARRPFPSRRPPKRSSSTAPSGSLDFETDSSIKSVVAFYRAAMKPLGWQAEVLRHRQAEHGGARLLQGRQRRRTDRDAADRQDRSRSVRRGSGQRSGESRRCARADGRGSGGRGDGRLPLSEQSYLGRERGHAAAPRADRRDGARSEIGARLLPPGTDQARLEGRGDRRRRSPTRARRSISPRPTARRFSSSSARTTRRTSAWSSAIRPRPRRPARWPSPARSRRCSAIC